VSPVKTDSASDGKLYRSISEVSELVGVKPHVLRYWETQFSMLRPRKNRAGNRMYRPDEIKLLMRIKELLYDRRFTIAGARRRLLDERRDGAEVVADSAVPQVEIGFEAADSRLAADRRLALHEIKTELQRIAARLREREPVGT
jgi:DNA-binding transcriptional MerR regulator